MSMFKRGYEVSRQEKARQDKMREDAGKKLWRFFLKDDGDEADLRFLTEEPVNFYEHTVSSGGRFDNYTCSGANCPLCAEGDKPSYKGAYLVIDKREYEYKDKEGKTQKGSNQLRLFVQGMRVISQLDRISDKYGLSNRDVTIVRLGKGTQTTYTIERGDEEKLTKKEIENLLPERVRDDYDGTVDSLMNMVEEQLIMSTKDYIPSEEVEEESSKIVPFDEDEEKPKKSIKKSMRRAENCLKPRAKHMLKK